MTVVVYINTLKCQFGTDSLTWTECNKLLIGFKVSIKTSDVDLIPTDLQFMLVLHNIECKS
jgi:hypothetical protein